MKLSEFKQKFEILAEKVTENVTNSGVRCVKVELTLPYKKYIAEDGNMLRSAIFSFESVYFSDEKSRSYYDSEGTFFAGKNYKSEHKTIDEDGVMLSFVEQFENGRSAAEYSTEKIDKYL